MTHWMRRVGVVTLGVLIFLALVDIGTIVGMGAFHTDHAGADAVVVFGSAQQQNARARAFKGYEVYIQGDGQERPYLVLSGGVTSLKISEAQFMKNAIQQGQQFTHESPGLQGRHLEGVILEQSAQDTWGNAVNSKRLLPGSRHVVVVTDSFHIARSVLAAHRAGWDHVSWDSPDQTYMPLSELVKKYMSEMVKLPEALLWYH